MKKITLTQGEYALVDDDDYEWLSKWKWYCDNAKSVHYALRLTKCSDGKKRTLSMHRLLLGLQFGDSRLTDHVDGNGLNNQRSNIRIATFLQNSCNRKIDKRNTSGYKGVSLDKRRNKWSSSIQYKNKQYHLGYFKTPVEAALAYNEGALKYHGEYANLNKIPKESTDADT